MVAEAAPETEAEVKVKDKQVGYKLLKWFTYVVLFHRKNPCGKWLNAVTRVVCLETFHCQNKLFVMFKLAH